MSNNKMLLLHQLLRKMNEKSEEKLTVTDELSVSQYNYMLDIYNCPSIFLIMKWRVYQNVYFLLVHITQLRGRSV